MLPTSIKFNENCLLLDRLGCGCLFYERELCYKKCALGWFLVFLTCSKKFKIFLSVKKLLKNLKNKSLLVFLMESSCTSPLYSFIDFWSSFNKTVSYVLEITSYVIRDRR